MSEYKSHQMTKCRAPIVGGRKGMGVPEGSRGAGEAVGDVSVGDFCGLQAAKARALRLVLLIFLTLDM